MAKGRAIFEYILKGSEQSHMEKVLAASAMTTTGLWALLFPGYEHRNISSRDVALGLKFFPILKTRNYQTLRIIKKKKKKKDSLIYKC